MYRFSLILISLLFSALTAVAQDKSGSRSGLVKLPEAGGTVGAEGGSFAVSSNKGASQYRLPLPELPVRSGFGPSVELSYSQFAGDKGHGLGIGWSFSVPSIDVSLELGIPLAGELESGEFRNYLTMQGQKLIFIRRDVGGLIYRLEASEEEVQVTYHKNAYVVSHASNEASIPSGFEVLYADGRRQLFSGDPSVAESSGKVVTRYPLVAEVAPWGETVQYNYVQDGGRSYLQEIIFAGGASRYRFELFEGSAHLTSFMMGYSQQSRKLYSKLVASYGDAIQAQWCFAYVGRNSTDRVDFAVKAHQDCAAQAAKDLFPKINNDSLSVLDELRAIYRFGNDARLKSETDRLPSMYFQYSSWTENSLANRDLVYPIPQLVSESGFSVENYELADANHDGLVDALRRNSNGTSDVFYATGDLKQPFLNSTFWTLKRGATQVSPDLSSPAFHFADLNGDSFVDLLQLNVSGDQSAIYLGSADGNFQWTGQLQKLTQDNSLGPNSFERGRAQFQDINADGLTDILTTAFDSSGATVWKVYLNTSIKNGERWNFRFLPKTFRFPFGRSTMNLADPNFRLIDANGDQLPDVIYLSASPEADKSGLCLYINNGKLYDNGPNDLLFGSDAEADSRCGAGGRFLSLKGLRGQPNLFGLWLIDVNGDGIMDVTTLGEENRDLLVWLGFGDQSIADSPLKLRLNLPLTVSGGVDASRSRVADIDGDGQMEILLFDAGADAKSKAVMIDFNRQADRQLIKSNLLTTVAFESGLRYDIRYATSTTERLRDQRLGRPVSPLHFPVVLAKQVVISQGLPSLARESVEVQEYFYHRPFYDADDKEFLGFSEVEVLQYGDDYAAESSLTREAYYTFAVDRAARKLAGKLKTKEVLRVAEDAKYREKAALSNKFDPNDPVTHSFLEESQRQSLPAVKQLVSRQSYVWEVVPQSGDWSFLRLTEEVSQRNSDEEGEATASPYVKKKVYEDFDTYNMPHLARETVSALNAPFQQRLPEVVTESSLDYEESRRKLKSRGIISSPDYKLVQRGGEVISYQRYVYDDRGLVEQEIDFVQSRLSDDIPGFSGERLTEYERTLTYGYDAFGNRTSVRDHFGLVEVVEYDAQGVFAVSRTTPKASPAADDLIWKFEYKDGRLDKFTNPLNLTVQIAYDNLGRRIQFLGNDGSEQRYEYKQGYQGLPTFVKTRVRRYADTVKPDVGETQWIESLDAYRPDGLKIASVEDATSVAAGTTQPKTGIRVKEYADYDRNKQKIFTWTPFSIFDGSPSVASVFAGGHQIPKPADQIGVRTKYDFLGRIASEKFPTGLEVAYEYAPWGQVARQTFDRRGQAVRVAIYKIEHDLGLYAQVEEDIKSGEAHITRFERDARGNLNAVYLPGETQPRRLIYDNRGLLEKQEIPGLGTTYQLYDQRDRLVASVRLDKNEKSKRVIENTYDNQDRLTTQILDGKLAHSNTYDFYVDGYASDTQNVGAVKKPLGLLTSTRSYDVTHKLFDFEEKLAYDAGGDIVHRQVKLGKDIYQESYEYLIDGSIKSVKNPMGLEGFYTSDAAGALRSVKIRLPGAQTVESIMDSISYNAKGQIDEILYRPVQGSYSTTKLSYDPRTLLLHKIQSSFFDGKNRQTLQDLALDIDGHAHILSIQDGIQDSALGLVNRTARFDYNWKGELIESQRFQKTLHYEYSPMGSFLLNEEQGPGSITQHPDNAMIPQGPAGQNYQFNEFGELKSSPKVIATQYNALGQLVFVETPKTRSYFGYNSAGDRVYKRVVAKADQALQESFYPMRSMSIEPKGAQSYLFVGESRLVRLEEKTGEWYYYLKDHLGSSDIMMHASGQPVEQMLYQPYGTEEKPEALSSAWGQQLGKVSEIIPREKTHHRFTGHYLDDDSGLYYMKARYYDPELGRFIQPDPLFMGKPSLCQERARECNLYGYAQNNPLKYTDPTGTIIETVWDIANVAMDVASLAGNVASGNWAGAAVDAAGLAADVTATVVPGLPGGAGTAIKAARAADKARDAYKTANRVETVAKAGADATKVAAEGKKARFLVTESGVAIPTNPKELKANLELLQETSTKPLDSKKFIGRDSQGPVRVRVEKAHPNDPDFTGVQDPMHTVDHLHIDRRANGETGSWKSNEKVEYDWPF
jgi:RHS repeat-associated protein